MFKAFFALVLLGIATSVTAHEIDIFNAKNFLKASTPANLMKSLIDQASGKIVKDGTVKFSKCQCDVADFNYNGQATFATPASVTKGINVGFNLGGLILQQTDVTNVDINVLWNNTPLHKEDHPMDNKIAANGPFRYNLSWAIPSFAPSGHYQVSILLSGKVGTSGNTQSVGCVQADFDL